MAKKKKSGLRVGSYVVRPLGIIIIAVLLVALLVVGALIIIQRVSGSDVAAPEPTPIVVEITPTPSPTVTPTPSPSPSPTPSPTPSLRSATIRSLGEIVIQQELIDAARTETSYDFTPMFEYINDVVGNADYTVGDVEGPMDNRADSAYSGADPFNTPPQIMLAMQNAGVDMLTLSNAHSMDMYFEGLQQTIQNCETAHMDYIGAYSSQEDFNTPKIVEINGINVGFLNYTTVWSDRLSESRPEAAAYGLATINNRNVYSDVTAAREAGADVVVAYISWGEVGQRTLSGDDQSLAMTMSAAGVDVIIGYHPHTTIAAYWLETQLADGTPQRTLCMCATGNFLSNIIDRYYSSGVIFEFTIQETSEGEFEITSPVYIPTYVWRYANEENDGYEYRVLAVGEWLDEAPEGMTEEVHTNLQIVWQDIQDAMALGNAGATVSAN